ncbi:Mu transposase C-terminal domain-containing protein [Rhodoferax sp. U11-2br]|uniref:Mu transposase C-terminal domain-containing protein n=1 Tax=Rhodoferax sp. U11-2br TaxID=2838878 RepID=UPI001BE7FC21|nr:Mu transposase C-terminal domain-containing protein [Rhodoferax sp. U11-2br]MBT3067960.1 Mu transposase C-terminal domain-containing protein [Rhodoferax sp. U11-2br]
MNAITKTEIAKLAQPELPEASEPLQALAINDVLSFRGKLVRLIAANPAQDIGYLIEVLPTPFSKPTRACRTALPFTDSLKQLRVEGVRQEDPAWGRPLSPSAAVQTIREERYARIRDLIANPQILEPMTRGPLLVAHATKVGVSKKTLLTDLRNWWQRGQVKDALMGDYHRCGRVTQDTPGALVLSEKPLDGANQVVLAPVRGKARGRHPIDGNYTPMTLSAAEKARILKYGRKRYEKDNTVSMRSVVANVITELYSLKDSTGAPAKDSKGDPLLPPLGSRPTHNQIRYLLQRILPVAKTHAKRNGSSDYLNNYAPTTGTVLDDCMGPGDVYECDDTTFDFHNCSEVDITVIIGKPTLDLVVDRFSRLIVGFHLSLDASCWENAKLALLSVCTDWKALCEKHGIKYYPADFPAQGVVCNRLFCDRGPYMTFASDELGNVGNDTTNAPAQLSRSKSVVESTFPRFIKLISELEGHEPQWNVTKRRRKPFEASACLTLTQLEGVVLRAIIALNREVLKDYPQSPADSEDGLLPIPREIWAREVERRNSLPRRVSREWLRQALLSRGVAMVTQDGIKFMDNFYACKEAVQKDWFSIASLKSPFEVAVRYTPKNLDEILVQDTHRKDVQYVARLTTKSLQITGNTTGLTDTRSAEIAEQRRHIRREAEIRNSIQRVGFLQDVGPGVAAAHEKMRAAAKGKFLASRKSNSSEIREAEAQRRRKVEQRVVEAEPNPAPTTNASPPANAAELKTVATPLGATAQMPAIELIPNTPANLADEILQSIEDSSVMEDFFASLGKI